MPSATFTYPAGDGIDVTAHRWDPEGTPVGAVQLTHGMGEHVLRYDRFARALIGRGFVVYGQDHRGHGATAGSPEAYGDLGAAGWAGLVDDIGRLSAVIRREHPGIPLVLFGHSMGSFAAQQYLLDHSRDVEAVVLTGTAALEVLGAMLDPEQPLDLTMFNAPFAPARTDYDWLSRDEAEVDAYVADPACGFGLDQAGGKGMFEGARGLSDTAAVAAMNLDLPIYIAVGDKDPVNGELALFHALVQRYQAAGVTDLTTHVYPGARHEILNETNRDEVTEDILAWLEKVVA